MFPVACRALLFSVAATSLVAAYNDFKLADNVSSDDAVGAVQKRDWLDSLLNGLIGSITGTVLSALQQNGISVWGTLAQKPLPLFRSDGGTALQFGWPWGKTSTTNANPYTSQPNTGITRLSNPDWL